MKSGGPKIRRIARWCLAAVAIVAIALLLLPLWLPWLLRPVLGQYGLSFKSYERQGFHHFILRDVNGRWDDATLHAAEVTCLQPAGWILRRQSGATNGEPGVIINGAVITIVSSTNTVSSGANTNSLFSTIDTISEIGVLLRREVPTARLTNCAVVFGSKRIALPTAEWRGGIISGDIRLESSPDVVHVAAKAESDKALSVALRGYDSTIHGELRRTATEWTWQGEATWLTNRAEISAALSGDGWWPTRAKLTGRDLYIPSELAYVPGYKPIQLTLEFNSQSNRFELHAEGRAQPKGESFDAPPVEFKTRARGDSESVTLEQLHLQTPWLGAELINQITIKRSGDLHAQVAQLKINADLSKIPGTNWSGAVNGIVTLRGNDAGNTFTRFDLMALDVKGLKQEAKEIVIQGQLEWPQLTLEKLTVKMADNSTLQAEGKADLNTREVGQLKWKAQGEFAKQLVPELNYESLEASGSAHGPSTNLTHDGKLIVEKLENSALKPTHLDIAWHGTMLDFTAANIQFAAGKSTVVVTGRFNLSTPDAIAAALQNVSLRRTNETLLSLQSPAEISFQSATRSNEPPWTLNLANLQLQGSNRVVALQGQVAWPTTGHANLQLKNIDFKIFSDFLKTDLGPVKITELAAQMSWTNGPLHSVITGDISLDDSRGGRFTAQGKLQTGDAIRIESLAVGSQYAPVLAVQGLMPMQILPGATNWLVTDEQRAISLHVTPQATNPVLAMPLGTFGHLQIDQPEVQIHASGTPAKPIGSVVVRARNIDWQAPTNVAARPRMTDFELQAELRPDLLQLRRFTVNVDDQPITANGECPMSPALWQKLWRERVWPDWTRSSGRLQITDAPVAVLARYLPTALAPEGRLTLDLATEPGPKLTGWLLLTNAATRPFGSFTPLRDIHARIRLEGPRATLEEFRGQIGGQAVRANGHVDIPIGGDLAYEVDIQGTNVPIARNVEFLLRGDVQMKFKGAKNDAPLLTGNVKLHHGLFLQYASDFVWSKPKKPELRPPYFSVTNEPFSDWKMDLKVQGDRFLRVRTPVFTGLLSANVQLQGTLGDPVMTGDARVENGRLSFPFGTLNVDQGDATINSTDPRGPDIRLNASGRNYNFAVRLEVEGPADGANISFTSTPPLTSEEILLMLTAGQVPQGQYSYSSQSRAGQLATFFGMDLFSRYTGSGSSQERLVFTSGENVTDEGRLTYSVEYLFTDRWSIVGEYDRFNAFNAHLKWKVYSK